MNDSFKSLFKGNICSHTVSDFFVIQVIHLHLQKLKRKLFCAELLRLSEEQLLRKIAEWMFTDEKWWDIVGPAMYKYVKAGNKAEGKMGNKV